MSEEEFLTHIAQALRRSQCLHDGMSFYDFKKRISEIMDEMTRNCLKVKLEKPRPTGVTEALWKSGMIEIAKAILAVMARDVSRSIR